MPDQGVYGRRGVSGNGRLSQSLHFVMGVGCEGANASEFIPRRLRQTFSNRFWSLAKIVPTSGT